MVLYGNGGRNDTGTGIRTTAIANPAEWMGARPTLQGSDNFAGNAWAIAVRLSKFLSKESVGSFEHPFCRYLILGALFSFYLVLRLYLRSTQLDVRRIKKTVGL